MKVLDWDQVQIAAIQLGVGEGSRWFTVGRNQITAILIHSADNMAPSHTMWFAVYEEERVVALVNPIHVSLVEPHKEE